MPAGARLERFGEKDLVFVTLQNADTTPMFSIPFTGSGEIFHVFFLYFFRLAYTVNIYRKVIGIV